MGWLTDPVALVSRSTTATVGWGVRGRGEEEAASAAALSDE